MQSSRDVLTAEIMPTRKEDQYFVLRSQHKLEGLVR